ncbi:hypothetical protein ARMGADRAFT_1065193 [Armillaria gallica]|uniref:Uncharacterized protein n=1 Tax=Armillaria gallica TaxID=47427 RepID=A0A2H3DPH3_ARMGA|nr:hypothetical protein ARMGADRAFT_1065193 [Armillaria gallica]
MATVMSLSGRVCLVTGAGTGMLDVLEEATESVTGIPGSVVPIQMDVADEESDKAWAKRSPSHSRLDRKDNSRKVSNQSSGPMCYAGKPLPNYALSSFFPSLWLRPLIATCTRHIKLVSTA